MLNFKVAVRTLALTTLVALGGCGGVDGVELNGGMFDVLGVGTGSQGPAREPKIAERSGLVLPPDARRLPTPGSEQEQQTASINTSSQWPTDPEEQKKRNAGLLQKQHEEFCQREILRKKSTGDITPSVGPLGNCGSSVFKALGYGNSGAVSEQYRTPEPKARSYSGQ